MRHGYDLFGWYTGPVPNSAARATDTTPANTSVSRVPGTPVSNWSGRAWIVRPYVTPPDLEAQKQEERRAQREKELRDEAYLRVRTEFHELISGKLNSDESADTIITVLPVFVALWTSIAPQARQANAQWQWVMDARTTFNQANAAIRNATTRAELEAVFPIGWPA